MKRKLHSFTTTNAPSLAQTHKEFPQSQKPGRVYVHHAENAHTNILVISDIRLNLAKRVCSCRLTAAVRITGAGAGLGGEGTSSCFFKADTAEHRRSFFAMGGTSLGTLGV